MGATRGAIFCGIVLAVVWLIAAAVPGLGNLFFDFARTLLIPVAALLSLAILLCLVSFRAGLSADVRVRHAPRLNVTVPLFNLSLCCGGHGLTFRVARR